MGRALFEIVELGSGLSLQDTGRCGWKRYGVPPGGSLDRHAARWANVLVGNPEPAPVLEILFAGARLRALRAAEIAVTGAAVAEACPTWHTARVERGDEIRFRTARNGAGVWTYLAVRGGFAADRWFDSVSVYPRGGLGVALGAGAVLNGQASEAAMGISAGFGRRWLEASERRDYGRPPVLSVWPGPQRDLFGTELQREFFARDWRVSPRSDRTGYRLEGERLAVTSVSMASEPVRVGSIQIPPEGLPILTMRDGPTVGGYPKLGWVDETSLDWLVQSRPGQEVRFAPVAGGWPALGSP